MGVSVPAKPIWRTIGPAHFQFGPQVFEKNIRKVIR